MALGRPFGSRNRIKLEGRLAAGKLLESPEYQESLIRRIKADTLPPAIEVMLWHYRYSKPAEVVEVEVSEKGALSAASTAELSVRAELLAKELKNISTVSQPSGAAN